jgi:signal transduction histidine kinase
MLFIGLGMILIDLVLGLMAYRRVVRAEMVQAGSTLSAIVRHIKTPPILSEGTIRYLSDLAEITNLDILMVDVGQSLVYQSKMDEPVAKELASFATANIQSPTMQKKFHGSYFGFLGQQYEHLFLVEPLRSPKGQWIGVVGVNVPLGRFSTAIMDGQRLVWVYIFFNLVVLSGLAYWRFSHFLIIPLQQIAKKAAAYQDDGFQLTSELQTDDVTSLSRSLDQMFRRIHTSRDELQKMVTTLEEVNDSLTKAQSDIIRAEKLASVGRLSAGIAHEIGNPLGIVLGYLELLKGDISEEERQDFTTRAMDEIQRINTIIRQLLDLARPCEGDCGESSVHELLHGFGDDLALQAVVGEMEMVFDLQAEQDRVALESEKLRQVFLNILLNGADAVKEGSTTGRMAISTRLINEDGAEHLEICFADNGPGIDPAHLKQVFDPFFTTKEVGHGTGLGLSVSYMIIENGGGTIQALSGEDGVGTTFRIVLPLLES